jgi:hypothetical protein
MAQADADEGGETRLTRAEKRDLAKLRREEHRVLVEPIRCTLR